MSFYLLEFFTELLLRLCSRKPGDLVSNKQRSSSNAAERFECVSNF